MSDSERRRHQAASKHGTRMLLAVAALTALAVVLTPTGSAKPPSNTNLKNYSLCLQGADVSSCPTQSTLTAGATTPMTLTITNSGGSPQTLGSMNFDAPAGLTLSSPSVPGPGTVTLVSGGTDELQIRNLNLAAGSSTTVTFDVQAPCMGGPYTWPTPETKQSNDFNGTGNDFNQPTSFLGQTSVLGGGGCALVWATQPTSAAPHTTITGTPFVQTGSAVEVAAVPGGCTAVSATCPVLTSLNGGTVTLSEVAGSTGNTNDFSGTTATFVNGYATFGGLEGNAGVTGTGFQLQGTSPGFTSTPYSDPFVIGNGEPCTGSGCPTFNTPINQSANVDSSATGSGFTFLAINNAAIPAQVTDPSWHPGYGCAGFQSVFPSGTGAFVETDGRTGTNAGTLEFTYYVDKTLILKRFGSNSGQPVIPICAGVERVNADGTAQTCTNGDTGAWTSFAIDPNNGPNQGTFTGSTTSAVCYGNLWWGILGTSNQSPSVDPTTNPAIIGWGSSTNYRYFNIQVPSPWDGHFGA